MCKKLFIDMDGTLARFHEHKDFEARMYERGFFGSLRPYTNVCEALRLFYESTRDIEMAILSSVPKNAKYADEEKRAWIKRYLPFVDRVHLVTIGTPKSELITKKDTCVLLDDFTSNLNDWKQAGGYGIKLINELNGKKANKTSWIGAKIIYNDQPAMIAYWLKEFVNVLK